MSLIEIILLGFGLSMDAFAVAVCKGLAMQKATLKKCAVVGAWFGSFQALMPFIGYLLGSLFSRFITQFDHWIAFILLTIIGVNMIKESFECEEKGTSDSLNFKIMFVMAVATSIDALAVGVTLAFQVNLLWMLFAISIIGITTFTLSLIGVKVGNIFGVKYKSKAELVGGLILILLGLKMLLEDLINL